MLTIRIALQFPRGYLSEPYWPEREKVITIRKSSGVDRARSDERRRSALTQGLLARGMTAEDYQAMEAAASRPFHVDADGAIILPAHHLNGMMAHAAEVAPAATRLARVDNIRIAADWGDLRTDRTKADGTFSRFVRNPDTNQRRFQESPYIADFSACGLLRLRDASAEGKARLFIDYAGREIGLGAGRKLGWGRFVITEWESR